MAEPECGEAVGIPCELVQALYGLKSLGAAWQALLAAFIVDSLNYKPTWANQDVYIQKNNQDGSQPYYEYLLVCIDNVLVISHAPEKVMKDIGEQFEIKNNDYGPPMSYLGAGISQVQVNDESMCWSMGSQKYVKAAVKTIQTLLLEDR